MSGYLGPPTYANAADPQHPAVAPIWLGMLVLYLLGLDDLGISVAVDSIPPFVMAAPRFLLAGTILLTWSVARDGRAFVLPTRREVRDSAIVGALLLGGGMGFVDSRSRPCPRASPPCSSPRCRSGSPSSAGSSWRAAAPNSRGRRRRRLRRGRRPRRTVDRRRRGALEPVGLLFCLPAPARVGDRVAVRVASRLPAAATTVATGSR